MTSLARSVTEEMRKGLQEESAKDESGNGNHSSEALLAEAALRLERACRQEASLGLRRVINASGVYCILILDAHRSLKLRGVLSQLKQRDIAPLSMKRKRASAVDAERGLISCSHN